MKAKSDSKEKKGNYPVGRLGGIKRALFRGISKLAQVTPMWSLSHIITSIPVSV